MIALALAGVVVAAAFLPWSEVDLGGIARTENGTNGDGIWTLLVAAALGAVVFGSAWRILNLRTTLTLIFLGGAIVALVGIIDWIDVESTSCHESFIGYGCVNVGIGLVLTTIAGLSIAALPIVVWRREATRKPAGERVPT